MSMLSHASPEARGRRLSTLGVQGARRGALHVVCQRNFKAFADLRADSAGLATSVAATTLSKIAAWPTGMAPLRPDSCPTCRFFGAGAVTKGQNVIPP